jgi:P27 family predicted phage terminase small subunit
VTRKKSNRSKRLSGNPGQRHVPSADVLPTGELGPPPEHLDAIGRRVWNDLGPAVVKATGAGNLDRLLFAGLCAAWSHHVHAERSVQVHGRVMEVRDANGVVKSAGPSPDFRVSLQALDVVKRMAADFGLSPGVRAASGIEPPVEMDPELAWILGNETKSTTVPFYAAK